MMVLLLYTFFVLHVWLLIYMLKAIKHSQIKHRETSDVTSASPHVLMEPVGSFLHDLVNTALWKNVRMVPNLSSFV